MKISALVLAGGGGTRLWPHSREELPKQFLSLVQRDMSFLQMTTKRLRNVADDIHIVTGSCWEALVRHQASDDIASVIEEPTGRNTAPAIALGLCALLENGAHDEQLVLVCPSDHVILDTCAFYEAVRAAAAAAACGNLVCFGIVPTSPDTGFGYIEAGEINPGWGGAMTTKRFVEKPDLKTASQYVKQGNYYWNGGIFLFRIKDMQKAFLDYAPPLAAAIEGGLDSFKGGFADLKSVSIDVAIFENAPNVALVPLDAGWSDLGSWDALYDVLDKDERKNACALPADLKNLKEILLKDCKNTMVYGSSRLVAAIDLEDVLIIDSPDALLVSKRGSSQKVKDVVNELKAQQRQEVTQTPQSARPWGTYRIVTEEAGVKVKRIMVAPGKRLSLQFHHHRNEHWIVLSGTAFVTSGGKDFMLHTGESAYITMGTEHRLSNPGKIPLEILEVQQGEYLGEDDIVRLDDDYRR